MQEVAGHFSSLRSPPARVFTPPEDVHAAESMGREIGTAGVPEKGVPACETCHAHAVRKAGAAYPDISGQYADYIVDQLNRFRDGRRRGADSQIMRTIASALTAEQSRAVALYYSLQPPQPLGGQ
jgi:cytochrome c553